MIYVNLGSQSRALQVQKLLQAGGIPAGIVSTPHALKSASEGCGYSVQFPPAYREEAASVLRRKGILATLQAY